MSFVVSEETVIKASADQVWKVIGDFFGIASWLPTVTCETAPDSNGLKTRLVTMTVTGAKMSEALDEINDRARTIKFHVLQSPFPISSCATEMSAVDLGDGTTKFIWSSNCISKPGTGDSVKPLLSQLYKSGVAALKAHIEG